MEITQELVERIARLARLSLSEEEKADMSGQLKEILSGVADLDVLQLEEEPGFLERLGVRQAGKRPLENESDAVEEYISADDALEQTKPE